MPKQNQIIAIEKGVKSRSEKVLTDVHHKLQKHDLLVGMARTYEPKNDDGERLPPERKLVQVRVQEQIERAVAALTEEFDVTATKEWTNCEASADVVVDGQTILKTVPVTYLLFLEKQLTRLAVFISKLPVLDPGEEWKFDPGNKCFRTDPTETVRTQKVQEPIVLYDATKEHPAQAQLVPRDIQIGTYKLTKMCGGMPYAEALGMGERVTKLSNAVKAARAKANQAEANEQKVGESVLQYVFEGTEALAAE